MSSIFTRKDLLQDYFVIRCLCWDFNLFHLEKILGELQSKVLWLGKRRAERVRTQGPRDRCLKDFANDAIVRMCESVNKQMNEGVNHVFIYFRSYVSSNVRQEDKSKNA